MRVLGASGRLKKGCCNRAHVLILQKISPHFPHNLIPPPPLPPGIPSIEMAAAGVDVVFGLAMFSIFESLAMQQVRAGVGGGGGGG